MPRVASSATARRPVGFDRRPHILEAGMRLFGALPYADVHMDAIAAAAGVAKPTLYRYFATKEALFMEGLAWELASLRAEIGAARSGTAADRLRRALALAVERIGRLAPAIQVVEGHDSELGAQSRIVLRAGFRALRDEIGLILRDGAGVGEFAPLDAEVAVLVILGGLRTAALSERRRALDPAALADLLLDGVRGPAGQRVREPHSPPANVQSGEGRSTLGAVA